MVSCVTKSQVTGWLEYMKAGPEGMEVCVSVRTGRKSSARLFFPSLSCYCEVIWEKAWPLMPNDPPLFMLQCSPIVILVTGESFNLQNSTLNDSRRFLFFHSFTSNPCFIVSVRKSGAEGAAVPAAARLVFPCRKQTNTLRRTGVAFRTLSSDSPFRWETETIYLFYLFTATELL